MTTGCCLPREWVWSGSSPGAAASHREPLVSRRLPQKNLTSNPNLTQTPALNLNSGPGFISLRESERLSAGTSVCLELVSLVCSLQSPGWNFKRPRKMTTQAPIG